MLEDAIAEPMPGDIRSRSAGRQRCWRPEISGLLITQEKCFPGCIGHGIVVPGSETKLVSILSPRIGRTALGDHRAKIRICYYIHPGRRRHLVLGDGDHVLAPIASESAQSIELNQVAGWQLFAPHAVAATGSSDPYTRDFHFDSSARADLGMQGSAHV